MTSKPNARYAGCTHARVHRHGTRACVLAHRCDCDPCQVAARQYAAVRGLAIAQGRWTPMVDAGPVREHVHVLRRHGMTLPQVARAASRTRTDAGPVTVRVSALERLMYGQTRAGSNQPVHRVRIELANALLAVKPEQSPALMAAKVERAVESLSDQGWDDARVGALLIGATPAVRAAVVRSATSSRALAAQAGPVLRTSLDRYVARTRRPLGATLSPEVVAMCRHVLSSLLPEASSVRARPAAVQILLRAGLSVPQTAQVLGVSRRTVERRVAAGT
ncbi:helix-turn-helix domain-containing protein [Cellulosimicrobium sp. Marseille-Q4280]|uniref:helix-turn-helix domain-containing protein n=1 Tax=Cellulosimicrobium sp. Marseille-Q4280 TaxID=2937992 RepID=UPI0020409346|nr:helix-turn-helix domain-containing protein [Cellulosimicrobium sp. Marseille-Q4280]